MVVPFGTFLDVRLEPVRNWFVRGAAVPRLELDGAPPLTMTWGTSRFPVVPGRHRLRVCSPFLFFRHLGDSSVVVDVAPGHVVQATWTMPAFVFQEGRWSVQLVAALSGPAWFADPAGRHELRYWDGAAWTAHVSNAGEAATDPLPGPPG